MEGIGSFSKSVAVYLRKSRAEENEDTAAVLARHKTELLKFARANEIEIQKIYEEVVSGDSLFARPRMVELLRDIGAGAYTGVLCMDIDRLGRGNMQEQGLILNTFKESGTVIITPEKLYDLNDEFDEMQTEFKTFMARQELKIIKKRLARGIRMTIEKGGYVSNVPFGYQRAYRDKIPTLAPCPGEAEYVKMIFDWYIGGEGCQSIALKLNGMGIKPRRSENFCRTSVRRILLNPTYTGKIVWGRKRHLRPKKEGDVNRFEFLPREKWQVFDGLHPAIVDEASFQKASRMLKGKNHVPCLKTGRMVNPLSGILFCRRCGRAMSRRPCTDGRGHPAAQLICPTPGCVKSSRADYVEEALVRCLAEELKDIAIPEETNREAQDSGRQAAVLRRTISRLSGQRERLYDLVEQGVYGAETFETRKKALSAKISALSEELRTAEKEADARRLAGEQAPRIRHVLQEYRNCTPFEKNRLLKSVVEKAYYYKPKTAPPKGFSLEILLKKPCLHPEQPLSLHES